MILIKKILFCLVVLGGLSGAFAEGKVFNKNYKGIKQILAEIVTYEGKIVVEFFSTIQVKKEQH